jgi:hypothetical protein
MTLEEILKADGWTDADLAAQAAVLNDSRLRATLEKQYGAVVTERDTYKQRDTEWQDLRDRVYQPQITRAEEEAARVRMEAAGLREQVQIAKDYGYLTADQQQEADRKQRERAALASTEYDPKRHPTFDDVTKFAEAEGQAIALASDLAAEYAYLNGGRSLFEYETEIDGRRMRGMTALREEAKRSRKNLDQFVSEKFNFRGKREEMATKRQQEHDDAIAKAATEKANLEWAQRMGSNPNLRPAIASQQPFIPAKPSDGKQPWERGTRKENQALRIVRFQQKVLTERTA